MQQSRVLFFGSILAALSATPSGLAETYQHDQNTEDYWQFYLTNCADTQVICANRYRVKMGDERLTSISFHWMGDVGDTAELAVWIDGNNDGHPQQSIPIWTQTLSYPGVDGFVTVELPSIPIGDFNQWFFVGLLYNDPGCGAENFFTIADPFGVLRGSWSFDGSNLSLASITQSVSMDGQGWGNTVFFIRAEGEPATCDGDVDGNGEVDVDDLNLILANWNQPMAVGDLSLDGVVDVDDLNLVLAAFAQPCGD